MEQRFEISLEALPSYEAQGFCADGVSFERDGAKYIHVHKNDVFDAAALLCFDPQDSAVLTRTVFEADNVKKAALTVTALGYFTPYINGSLLTEDLLIPPKTDYNARDLTQTSFPTTDKLSHRVYYYEYDILPFLQTGKNVFAAHIGAGWYADNKNPAERMPVWGEMGLIFKITLTDANGNTRVIGSAAENTVWQKSYIRSTSLYYGEFHDYSFFDANWNKPGFDDGSWKRPAEKEKPLTFFQKADFPADRETDVIVPKVIAEYAGRKLYDLGEVAAGRAVIAAGDPNRRNIRVILRYGDRLNDDCSFALRHTGGDWREQTDCFLLQPGIAEACVQFLWHASRYIELTGNAHIVRFVKLHTPLPQVGFFESDNETLNWIFNAYVNTQKTNFHGSIPSDYPHRERLGYTGDGQLCAGAAMSVFDMRAAYKKWMRDIRDCQDICNGHVQHTAPYYGGGGGPGGWGGAAAIVPWRYYQFYNDRSALELSYHSMKAYIGYMLAHSENGLVVRGEKGGWCLGDWCPPDNKIEIPEPFVNTYFLLKCLDICEKTAQILGETADAAYFKRLKETETEAFNGAFFDPATGSYCGGVQGADAFAIALGLGDDRTKENLIRKYEALGEFDTGIFGTDLVIRVLFALGEGALAFRLLTNETENSFYNMMLGGTNTLWENWDGCDSLCHPMFGAVNEYLFSYILGIRRYDDRPGFADIVIDPAKIPGLAAKGSYQTPDGRIKVSVSTDEHGKQTVSFTVQGDIAVHME